MGHESILWVDGTRTHSNGLHDRCANHYTTTSILHPWFMWTDWSQLADVFKYYVRTALGYPRKTNEPYRLNAGSATFSDSNRIERFLSLQRRVCYSITPEVISSHDENWTRTLTLTGFYAETTTPRNCKEKLCFSSSSYENLTHLSSLRTEGSSYRGQAVANNGVEPFNWDS